MAKVASRAEYLLIILNRLSDRDGASCFPKVSAWFQVFKTDSLASDSLILHSANQLICSQHYFRDEAFTAATYGSTCIWSHPGSIDNSSVFVSTWSSLHVSWWFQKDSTWACEWWLLRLRRRIRWAWYVCLSKWAIPLPKCWICPSKCPQVF